MQRPVTSRPQQDDDELHPSPPKPRTEAGDVSPRTSSSVARSHFGSVAPIASQNPARVAEPKPVTSKIGSHSLSRRHATRNAQNTVTAPMRKPISTVMITNGSGMCGGREPTSSGYRYALSHHCNE